MTEKTNFKVIPADPEVMGVHRRKRGVLFAAAFPEECDVDLLLYHAGDREPCQAIPLDCGTETGEVRSVQVEIPGKESYEYMYFVDGEPYVDPRAEKIRRITDPASGEEVTHCVLTQECVSRSHPLHLPYENCIFYKLHVKGFTQNRPAGVRHPGTFRGLRERIPYLTKLGVTSVILMPIYEFDRYEKKEKTYSLDQGVKVKKPDEDARANYWGYTGGLYFAPKQSYSSEENAGQEFADLVDALHRKNLECIPEFFFRSNEDPRLVTDVLRHWLLTFHVDGFHLVGEGSWIQAAITDPLLKTSKILYSYFDTNSIYGNSKPFRRNLGIMNLEYEHLMRKFLKGDEDVTPDAVAWMLRRNPEKAAFVNYIADQDGFTLADMVSYGEKHNEANGEDNKDGTNENLSWNCGEEGPSRKNYVRDLRQRQLRNAFLLLLTAQSAPMIYAGDESENSQGGNNNAWCQDNSTGWVDWGKTVSVRQMHRFVEQCILFRKEHPVLHRRHPLRMSDYQGCGFPDISYHSQIAWMSSSGENKCSLGVFYCGRYASREDGNPDDDIYIAYNMYWEPQLFALPDLPDKRKWVIKADTDLSIGFYEEGSEPLVTPDEDKCIKVPGRSIQILLARPAAAEEG